MKTELSNLNKLRKTQIKRISRGSKTVSKRRQKYASMDLTKGSYKKPVVKKRKRRKPGARVLGTRLMADDLL